ncbi:MULTISPECIES: dihydropteroate synthase [Peptoniphilus]|jgi:dihydropteroate synthase|uniref:dihydropteroate synthase n=1 Tax=Peptoniphilus TaxID=162289 RepID=UPI0008D9E8BF|nr:MULTISPECIES: dihydropteroate synthase [Peptoniphilus]MBS6610799.1 dihydropteroate synthase [Peptoniphilus harei]MDU1043185.1 dihydropteroate synthase [Peptoniphilus rhinitidis]MDU1954920.1 dihydropteroate synthase [Peptoniphilus lacydonensis]MDU2110328.1 dihydropteroate synthase [Peptoniphilus lacydonensis]MDU2114917.1 dihydropteroate synthase [Peptoniphilus lacydonensis]
MEELICKYKNKVLESGKETILCGIINVTPDSFSDGGKFFGVDKAVKRAMELIESGARMIDVGGESTRPGSTYVEVEEEISRVIPVIKKLKEMTDVPISIDTWKADVAEAAIEAGVDFVNDITGFMGDPKMAEVVGKSDVGAIVMFNPKIARPKHKSSANFPSFGGEGAFTEEELKSFEDMDIVEVMKKYFEKALLRAHENGIERERIMLDPGIGFALTKKENLKLIDKIDTIRDFGCFIFLGVSRKRFITNILSENNIDADGNNEEGFENRDEASAALTTIASYKGVEVLRVHTMKHHLLAKLVADSVRLNEVIEDVNFKPYSL